MPLNSIERTLVGWFEVNNYRVEHDGHEWFTWIGERMIPVTEIAVAIKLDLEKALGGSLPAR